MLQVYKILTCWILVFLALTGYAQDEGKGAIFGENSTEFKRQLVGGPILHTAGLGATFAWGKRVNGFQQRMIQLEFVTLKHEKESRFINSNYADSKGFVYGKLNQPLLLRSSIGFKHQKYDKLRPSGVEVGYAYGIGPTFALLKPVYLDIAYSDQYTYVETERYDPEIHDINQILGRGPNLKGINEIKLVPGIHAKFGMVFEYSPYKEGIKGLEVGAMVDVFPKKLPIMAFANNHSVFFNFYLQLLFGKKYIQ